MTWANGGPISDFDALAFLPPAPFRSASSADPPLLSSDCGVPCRWDEEISLDAAGDRIEPLYSMAPEWRMGLRSGDLVEVKYENLRWGAGRIAHREGENIRVMDVNDGARLLGVFPISSDMIWYVHARGILADLVGRLGLSLSILPFTPSTLRPIRPWP